MCYYLYLRTQKASISYVLKNRGVETPTKCSQILVSSVWVSSSAHPQGWGTAADSWLETGLVLLWKILWINFLLSRNCYNILLLFFITFIDIDYYHLRLSLDLFVLFILFPVSISVCKKLLFMCAGL